MPVFAAVDIGSNSVRLSIGERRLRHERTQAGVLRLGGEERALFLGNREFGAQSLEPIAHVDEATLEQGLGHT